MGLFSGNKMYPMDDLTVLEAVVLKTALREANSPRARDALEHMQNCQFSRADVKYIVPLLKEHYTNLKTLLLGSVSEKDAIEIEKQADACVSCAAKLKRRI